MRTALRLVAASALHNLEIHHNWHLISICNVTDPRLGSTKRDVRNQQDTWKKEEPLCDI